MNEAVLSERLRALREPAPRNGFEQRLQQALWQEARAPRRERAPAAGKLLRVRRWGGRFGLGMIIACGATAAAAASGIWAAVAYSERPTPAPSVAAPADSARGAALRARSPNAEASPELSPSNDPALAPAEPSQQGPGAADAPAAAATPDSPGKRAVSRPERARAAPRESTRLVPFELPERGASTRGPADSAVRLEPRQLPEARGAQGERAARDLPALPSRVDRGSHGEKSASDRGEAPPGHDLTRERGASAKNADRGSERAREVRERK